MRTVSLHILLCIAFCISVGYSQFSVQMEHIGSAKNSTEKNTVRATLMKNGAAVFTVERTLPFDVPYPSATINETTGMFILSYTFDGFVEAYNASGKKMWEQNFFKEKKPNYERTITAALGNHSIAFLTSDVTLSNAVVHKFTTEGRQEWETSLPYSMGYEVAMSPDEQTIVAGTYFASEGEVKQQATVVDTKGTITASADILFRSASFNSDGSLIALASEREAVIYDVKKKKETARAARKTGDIISNIMWRDSEVFVLESSVQAPSDRPFYFSNPVVIRYSSAFIEVSRNTYPLEKFKQSSLKDVSGSIELHCDARIIKVE